MNGVINAFERIDTRLSDRARSKDTSTRYIPFIGREKEYLEKAFLEFFPELMGMVKETCYRDDIMHWKIPRHLT